MKTQCPHCKAKINAPDEYKGKKLKCPKCKELFACVEPAVAATPAKRPKPAEEVSKKCENCGRTIGKLEQGYVYRGNVVCPECNEHLQRARNGGVRVQSRVPLSAIGFEKALGIAGSIILFLGVFAPIVSIPIMGSLNYFQNGKGDGTIIIILAVIALILTLAKKYKGLWFPGLCSLGVLVFTFVNFHIRISQAHSDMQQELANNPFSGFGELVLHAVQLQWGWAILVFGAALILGAAGVNMYKSRTDLRERNSHRRLLMLALISVALVTTLLFVATNLLNQSTERETLPSSDETEEAAPNVQINEDEAVLHRSKIEIRVISKPMFGIYLGEQLKSLARRFEITPADSSKDDADEPSKSWVVTHNSDTVRHCFISTLDERVFSVVIVLSDSSEENFEAIHKQIRDKYKIERESGGFSIDPERFFGTRVDGVKVGIYLKLEKAFMEDDTLSISYVHVPLFSKRDEEFKRRKSLKIHEDL